MWQQLLTDGRELGHLIAVFTRVVFYSHVSTVFCHWKKGVSVCVGLTNVVCELPSSKGAHDHNSAVISKLAANKTPWFHLFLGWTALSSHLNLPRRKSTTALWPRRAAKWSGVYPRRPVASDTKKEKQKCVGMEQLKRNWTDPPLPWMSAPAAISIRTT